jgi:hypothetical protein
MGSVPATPNRKPASEPENYTSLSACQKQQILWDLVERSEYQVKPALKEFGAKQLLKMFYQRLSLKGSHHSDFAPAGWEKYIHPHGSIAKMKWISHAPELTGIYKGAECGLLRLSLTYAPGPRRPVAPGLAVKILRDGMASANVSALVSLNGQGENYNFFSEALSNVVPAGSGIGQSLVHLIFSSVSRFPESISVKHFSAFDDKGQAFQTEKPIEQLFFVPSAGLPGRQTPHDARDDFANIPIGTSIYKVYAVVNPAVQIISTEYSAAQAAERLKDARLIGEIVTQSRFIASDFGDAGIFFRHEINY